IYDDDDQRGLIRQTLKDLNLDEKYYQPQAVLHQISAAKSELISPLQAAEYARNYREEIVARIYRRYQELLAQNHALDFDDLLMVTIQLFREQPQILEHYQDRYMHTLVDEFQDTNIAQYALVKLLAGKHRNLCVVGDEDQSIYSWRQADIRNILNFEQDFPEAKVVVLDKNYRSTQTILEAARAVIAPNQQRKEKHLWTDNPAGVPVIIRQAYDENEEADFVATQIERLIGQGLARLGDCAVMYRTNAQSRAVEEAFLRHRLPYQLVGGIRFYERQEIRDIVAYLRLTYNPYDALSLHRVINVPPRGIGIKTWRQLETWANELGIPLFDALGRLTTEAEAPFSSRAKRGLADFAAMIERWSAASHEANVADLLSRIVQETNYRDFLLDGTETGEEKWQNVQELATVAQGYSDLEPGASLASLLEEIALVSEMDEVRENPDAITLMTLHAAKGLEFPIVFIIGMEEGICPHIRSFDDPDRLEEERRLTYVGITRAKERLYLVHALRRMLYGATMANPPSRYLEDIPPHLVRQLSINVIAIPEPPREEPTTPTGEGGEGPRFKAGDRVFHPQFGEGTVESSLLTHGDEEVTVSFPGLEVKRLSAAFARLERR
ncbi:MAG: UvrD-helicase domain-containing protein, partial [Chloroflexi bacterium]|nr:UvrD-helicase domain-containing protein [Chloroflexota bacterium]